MASARIGRINDDIQRILADRLRQVKDPRVSDQGMITITRVDTTGDLRYAKVWLSVYGLKDEKEFKKGLKSASGWLRREVGSTLKLVYTPELVFELDKSIEYGAKISNILENLNIPELSEEDAEDWE
jgi:ribosome-binding factor A